MRQLIVIALAAMLAAPLAAQVAPTLPRDTLGGRKLPPEANVPRGIVAPTLPRDTLGGAKLPPSANVVRSSVPETPSDTLNARSRDSVATAREGADSAKADSARADSARAESTRRRAVPARRRVPR